MHLSRYRSAALLVLAAFIGSLIVVAPSFAASDCPSGLTQFKIDSRPSNGSYSDGTLTVTISNSQEDSFSWSSNIEVESVMVKGGPGLQANPGGTSGTAYSPDNEKNGQRYGVSHVSFCYSTEEAEEEEEEESEEEEEECPDNGSGGGGMNDDCDEEEEEECPDGDKGGDKGGMDDDCGEDEGLVDEEPTRPAAPNKPNRPDDDVEAGRINKPAKPDDDVRGIRVAAENRVAPQTAPEVQAQQQPPTLPRTGVSILPFVLLGLGLATSGTLLWRRRSN